MRHIQGQTRQRSKDADPTGPQPARRDVICPTATTQATISGTVCWGKVRPDEAFQRKKTGR